MSVDYIPLPAADLVFGLSEHEHHVVTSHAANKALDECAGGDPRMARTAALCRRIVGIATAGGPYSRDAALRHPTRCPDCAWILALNREDIEEEITAFTSHDALDFAVITTRLGDVGGRLLAAIAHDPALLHEGQRLGPSHRSQLLGHATRHLPVVGMCEECAEIGVVNAHGYGESCPAQEVICPGCTATAHGVWAGEWEGMFLPECTVTAPCSVLATLSAHYQIPIGPAGDITSGQLDQLGDDPPPTKPKSPSAEQVTKRDWYQQ